MKLVYGVGFNDRSRQAFSNGIHLKEYRTWSNMLRCYSDDFVLNNPTYLGVTVSDNFKHYSYFYDWCHDQIGFGENGFQISKNILSKQCKKYSEENCVFIPQELNKLLTKSDASRGLLPVGIDFNKANNKYRVRVRVDGRSKLLGYFTDVIDAFVVYKEHKEREIKSIAERNKHKIDIRAYDALMNYKVDITD